MMILLIGLKACPNIGNIISRSVFYDPLRGLQKACERSRCCIGISPRSAKQSFRAARRNDNQGFTLIELLLSIVILSAGLVVIDQILLASASSLSYVDNRTAANHLMANKIWEIGDQADRGKLFPGTEKGVMAAGDRKIDYQLKAFPEGAGSPLISMSLALQWEQTGRRKSISRSFYTLVRNGKKV